MIGEGVFIYGSVLAGALIVIGPSALYQDTWFYAKLFLITGVCQTCLYYNEFYDLNITAGAKELSTRLLQSFGFASLLLGFIYIAFPETIIGSLVFMIGVGIVVVLITCWRFFYSLVLGRGILNQPIILLGSGDLNRKIRDEILARNDCGYTVIMELPECIEPAPAAQPAEVQLVCQNKFKGLCEQPAIRQYYNLEEIWGAPQRPKARKTTTRKTTSRRVAQ